MSSTQNAVFIGGAVVSTPAQQGKGTTNDFNSVFHVQLFNKFTRLQREICSNDAVVRIKDSEVSAIPAADAANAATVLAVIRMQKQQQREYDEADAGGMEIIKNSVSPAIYDETVLQLSGGKTIDEARTGVGLKEAYKRLFSTFGRSDADQKVIAKRIANEWINQEASIGNRHIDAFFLLWRTTMITAGLIGDVQADGTSGGPYEEMDQRDSFFEALVRTPKITPDSRAINWKPQVELAVLHDWNIKTALEKFRKFEINQTGKHRAKTPQDHDGAPMLSVREQALMAINNQLTDKNSQLQRAQQGDRKHFGNEQGGQNRGNGQRENRGNRPLSHNCPNCNAAVFHKIQNCSADCKVCGNERNPAGHPRNLCPKNDPLSFRQTNPEEWSTRLDVKQSGANNHNNNSGGNKRQGNFSNSQQQG
jgi:hypothetical protein